MGRLSMMKMGNGGWWVWWKLMVGGWLWNWRGDGNGGDRCVVIWELVGGYGNGGVGGWLWNWEWCWKWGVFVGKGDGWEDGFGFLE